MPASRGWWRLRVSTMTLKQRDWWLEHRDALKRNGPKLYFMYWMGIRISVWWVRCCVVCSYIVYAGWCCCCWNPARYFDLFFFPLYSVSTIHSGILSVVCMFHLLSAILFVSLVRFLVSLIASRYSMPMQNNTHIRGQTYMYIKFA